MNSARTIARVSMTLVMVLSMAVSIFSTAAAATFSATIDFEGVTEGAIVSSVAAGSGISGDDGGGSVGVLGFHPFFAPSNAAMIFDATCGGSIATCSGGDDDLYNPGFGNVLIISEDLDSSDPDDSDHPDGYFQFDYSTWADGIVTVESISVQDIESAEGEGNASVQLYSGATLLTTVPIPDTGDGVSETVLVGVSGVDRMIVDLNGSGAIDNIAISWEEDDGDEFAGCTPGFWKQQQHFGSWDGYLPGDSFDATFGVSSSFGGTLLEALEQGGGGEAALGRHAVAALLNAASPDVNYLYSQAEVITNVQNAYATGEFEPAKDAFEVQNELGCSLD